MDNFDKSGRREGSTRKDLFYDVGTTGKAIWEKRYAEKTFDLSADPINFLKNSIQRLRKGKALDVAMGAGRNSIYLAEQGFDVIGFDFIGGAIEEAQKRAAEKNLKIEAKATDLDFYIMPIMGFDSIIVSYFKPLARYFSEIKKGLAQGGTVLIENYLIDELVVNKSLDPRNLTPMECFQPNEVLFHLRREGLRVIHYNEEIINGHSIVQCIAEKPFEKDALKYGFAEEKGKDQTSAHQLLAESLFKKKS